MLQLATCASESAPSVGMSPRDTAVMVRKFCTGSLDKDAGPHAANQHSEALNGAIHHILRYQLNCTNVYGKDEDQLYRPATELVNVRATHTHTHIVITGIRDSKTTVVTILQCGRVEEVPSGRII